jgi:hypothetical protein
LVPVRGHFGSSSRAFWFQFEGFVRFWRLWLLAECGPPPHSRALACHFDARALVVLCVVHWRNCEGVRRAFGVIRWDLYEANQITPGSWHVEMCYIVCLVWIRSAVIHSHGVCNIVLLHCVFTECGYECRKYYSYSDLQFSHVQVLSFRSALSQHVLFRKREEMFHSLNPLEHLFQPGTFSKR